MSRSHPAATFAILAISVGSFATLQSLVVPVLPVIQSGPPHHHRRRHLDHDRLADRRRRRHARSSGASATWSASAASSCSRSLAVALGSVVAAVAPTIGVLIAGRVSRASAGRCSRSPSASSATTFPARRLPSRDRRDRLHHRHRQRPRHRPRRTARRRAQLARALPRARRRSPSIAAVLALDRHPRVADPRDRRRQPVVGASCSPAGWSRCCCRSAPGAQWGWASPAVIGLFVLAALLLAAWIVVELRSRHPLVDMRLMREPGVWSMNAAAVFIGASMFARVRVLPAVRADAGLDRVRAGRVRRRVRDADAPDARDHGRRPGSSADRWRAGSGSARRSWSPRSLMALASLSLAFLHGSTLAELAIAAGRLRSRTRAGRTRRSRAWSCRAFRPPRPASRAG